MARTLYRVFVDETGDRGWGGRASPIFVMSAVIVRDSDASELPAALDRMNAELAKPSATVLHWAENVKAHTQRKFVSRDIAKLPITLTNTVVMKRPMMGSGTELSDAGSMYNYAIRRLLERITWYVDDHGGEAIITFAHVRRFPYERLWDYLNLLSQLDTEIRWKAIRGRPRIDQPSRVRGLQTADLAAGALGSALRKDDYGAYEPAYLAQLVPQIYIRGHGAVTSYGMNVIGPPGCMDAYPWWTSFLGACATRGPSP